MNSENMELDFKNLIKCALNQKISWPVLKIVLDSATTTLKESKKLNVILLDQLESMHSKPTTEKKQENASLMIEPLEKDGLDLLPCNDTYSKSRD